VTVGALGTDGLVLQLKLKKAAKACERDPVCGVWYVYQPVGGAVTLPLNENQEKRPSADGQVVAQGGRTVIDRNSLAM
jgi:hypothetical protein